MTHYNDLYDYPPDDDGLPRDEQADEEMQVCPYCNGTNMDLDGDSGGGCTHCFNGYLPKGF